MTDENASLVPIEEKAVEFYGDEVVAVAILDKETGERRVYVPMRQIAEHMGLDWSGQRQRIMRDTILSAEIKVVGVTTTTSAEAGQGGGVVDTMCLPLEMLHGWMFGISTSRVKAELQPIIERYKRECYRALWEAFRPDQSINSPPPRTDRSIIQAMHDNALAQARMWRTIMEEQERSRYTELTVQQHEEELWEHSKHLSEHDRALVEAYERLEALRDEQSRIGMQLTQITHLLPSPNEPITPQQKAQLQEMVKELVAAAQDRGIRLGQGKSDYPAVWGAFNQRFRIAKYAELPSGRFDEAVRWLEAWQARVVGE